MDVSQERLTVFVECACATDRCCASWVRARPPWRRGLASPYNDPEVFWLEEEKTETRDFNIYIYPIQKSTRAKERIDTRQTFS